MICLVIYLKHCLYYLVVKHDFTHHLEQNDPEKQLKQWVIAFNNLLTATHTSIKSHLPTSNFTVLGYNVKIQPGSRMES